MLGGLDSTHYHTLSYLYRIYSDWSVYSGHAVACGDYKASTGHTPGLTGWGGYARGDGGGGVAAEIVTVPA